MEFFTIFLASLLALVSPVGLVIDRIALNAIRSQFTKVDQLQVRVDNAPSYQLLQGKVERVRIAGRGLKLKQIRIAVLELETDPINLKPRSLGQKLQLKLPFQAGVRLVLTQADINKALQSPEVTATLLRQLSNQVGRATSKKGQSYNFVNPRLELLADRLRFQVELTQADVTLAITLESGLNVIAGRQIQLVQPIAWVNGEQVPSQIVTAIATNFSQKLNLGNFETYAQARILQLKVAPQKLEITAFLRVEPSSRLLRR